MTVDGEAHVGDRVRERRLLLGLSQTELAGEGLSTSHVSLVESGRRVPGEAVLAVLARRLETSVGYLRDGVHDVDPALVRAALATADTAVREGRARDALLAVAELDRSRLPHRELDEVDLLRARAHEQLTQLSTCLEVLTPVHDRALRGDAGVAATQSGVVMCRALVDGADLHGAAEVGAVALQAAVSLGLVGTTEHLRLVATVMGVHYERGDLLHAQALADRYLPVAEQEWDAVGQGGLHWNSALVAEARGRLDDAVHHSRRAIDLLVDPGYARDVMFLQVGVAWILLRLDPPQVDEAAAALEGVRDAVFRLGSDVDRAYWHDARSKAWLLGDDPLRAEAEAREALALLRGDVFLESSQARLALGDALLAQHRSDDAAAEYVRAAEFHQMVSASRQSARQWQDVADRLRRAGRLQEAADAYAHSLDSAGIRSSGTPSLPPFPGG